MCEICLDAAQSAASLVVTLRSDSRSCGRELHVQGGGRMTYAFVANDHDADGPPLIAAVDNRERLLHILERRTVVNRVYEQIPVPETQRRLPAPIRQACAAGPGTDLNALNSSCPAVSSSSSGIVFPSSSTCQAIKQHTRRVVEQACLEKFDSAWCEERARQIRKTDRRWGHILSETCQRGI